MTQPRAFIFDLDGTLVDSNELHIESWERAFQHFGKRFSREQQRAQIGKGSDQHLPAFLSSAEMVQFGQALDYYRSKIFKDDYRGRVRPFPQARPLCQRIYDDGKQIVLATSGSKSATKFLIDLLEIEELIVGFASADDAERSKPAPDIFRSALDKLDGISAAETITVGDTRFDIEAAGKAGLRTIALL